MAIAYSTAGIIISDDLDPSRPRLVLPVGTASAEIAAAAAEYLPAIIEPNYVGFYSALLGSNIYAAVINQPKTADSAFAMAVFVSAIQDCMASRENRPAMQGAIWLLLIQVTLTDAHAIELAGLMATHHLSGLYLLAPPTPERARDADGQFIADDPATPDVDEAWA